MVFCHQCQHLVSSSRCLGIIKETQRANVMVPAFHGLDISALALSVFQAPDD